MSSYNQTKYSLCQAIESTSRIESLLNEVAVETDEEVARGILSCKYRLYELQRKLAATLEQKSVKQGNELFSELAND